MGTTATHTAEGLEEIDGDLVTFASGDLHKEEVATWPSLSPDSISYTTLNSRT